MRQMNLEDEEMYSDEYEMRREEADEAMRANALDALQNDNDFLKKGDVFSDDQLNAYIDLKWEDVYNLEHNPHPIEFSMYYSV